VNSQYVDADLISLRRCVAGAAGVPVRRLYVPVEARLFALGQVWTP